MFRFASWFLKLPLWQRTFIVAAAAGIVDVSLTTHATVAAAVGGLTDPNSPQAVVSNLSAQYVAPTSASMAGASAGVGSVAWALEANKPKLITQAFGVAFAGTMGSALTVGVPTLALNGAKLMSGNGALVRVLPHLTHALTHLPRIIGH
jgi:hypothetical protein